MTIAKALKKKNKLVKEINSLQRKIQKYNSYIKGNKTYYDAKELYKELQSKITELVDLKDKLQKANGPIHEKIFLLSEAKGMLVFLQSLDPKEGKEYNRYSGDSNEIEFESSMNREYLDEHIKKYENLIEKGQDELDHFNFTTEI